MQTMERAVWRITLLAMVVGVGSVIAGGLAGCAGDADAGPEAGIPAVDPRMATADAYLDFYNTLNTANPVRYREIRNEIRAETPEQRRMLDSYDYMLSMIELQLAVDQHISDRGELIEEDIFKPSRPARITERLGDRVIAVYLDSTGSEETVHLVKLDGRWWISGYTLEYSHEFADLEAEVVGDYEAIGVTRSQLREVARLNETTAERVRRGEFATFDEVNDSVSEGLRRIFGR